MYSEEIIKRKIRIRNEAHQNMLGEGNHYNISRLNENEKDKLCEKIYHECRQIDEYSCNKVYTEIFASSKIVLFIKKVLRRICYKVMGWYYVPIVEGQIEYNRQMKQTIIDLQQLVASQQEEIKELYKKVNET